MSTTFTPAISTSRGAVRPLAAVLALALASAVGLATAPQAVRAAVPEAEFAEASAQMQRASAGDKSAVDGAAEAFAKLSASEPGDPLLRAYAGASQAMKAGTTMLPWKKMGYAEDGLALLDKALAQLTPAHDTQMHRQVPVSLETRFVAANTFLSLPAMFNRHDRGLRLIDEVMASPLFGPTPAGFKAVVWQRAARAAQADKRPADEKRYLELVAASGTPLAAPAQAQLKELK